MNQQKMQMQITFAQDVKSFKRAIKKWGDNYNYSIDLLALDSRNITDSAVAVTMLHIDHERLGFDQYVT